MNIFSPKERFMRDQQLAAEHRQLAVRPTFLAALDAALLQYQERITAQATGDIAASAAAFHRIAGAREFIGVLLNLSVKVEIEAKRELPTLNHRV